MIWIDGADDHTAHPLSFGRKAQAFFTGMTARQSLLNKHAHAIRGGLAALTTADAVDAMAAHHVPGGPVLSRDEVFDDPQVQHLESIVQWDHPTAGTLLQAGPPGRFSATQPEFRPQIGAVGEHTDDILRELGRDDAQIATLREVGVVA